MGTIMNPLFIQSYIQAAAGKRLPNMLPRTTAKGIEMMGVSGAELSMYGRSWRNLKPWEFPCWRELLGCRLSMAMIMWVLQKIARQLPEGNYTFHLSPSVDTPKKVRAICPDWQARVANYNAFMSDDLKKFIEAENIKPIGYRAMPNAIEELR